MHERMGHHRHQGIAPLVRTFVAGILAFALAVACTMLGHVVDARAEERSTLTLHTGHVIEGKEVTISGIEATAYRVATIDEVTGEAHLIEPFTGLGDSFKTWEEPTSMRMLVPRIAKIIRDYSVQGVVATSTDDGMLAFGELPHGVYFVMQTGASGDALDYYSFISFLISVPQVSGDAVSYDVLCEPKFTPTPEEPDNPEPDNPEPDNPTPDNPTPDNPEPDNPEPDNPTPDNPTPDNPSPDKPTGDSTKPGSTPGSVTPGGTRNTTSGTSTTSRGTSTPSTSSEITEASASRVPDAENVQIVRTPEGTVVYENTPRNSVATTTSRIPLTKTGDMTNVAIVGVAVLAGVALLLFGLSRRARGTRD